MCIHTCTRVVYHNQQLQHDKTLGMFNLSKLHVHTGSTLIKYYVHVYTHMSCPLSAELKMFSLSEASSRQYRHQNSFRGPVHIPTKVEHTNNVHVHVYVHVRINNQEAIQSGNPGTCTRRCNLFCEHICTIAHIPPHIAKYCMPTT